MSVPSFGPSVLEIDCAAEVKRISRWMVDTVAQRLHRRGVIVALSGGVDSSVCGALAVQALGPKRVFGLLMPEQDSASSSAVLGARVAEQLGIKYATENIGATLEAIGCYRRRDDAIRAVFPEYAAGWKSKIAIAGGVKAKGGVTFFKLVVQSPAGETFTKRLPIRSYLELVAATNFKQRIRKNVEYFHADRLNYAVIGTPNRLEYDQGFFVKNGDGAADLKPIAHLFKTQVYALARHLHLPEEVCAAMPTTDTYSLRQGQEEFYFALPYDQMDLALWAHNHALPAQDLATALGVSLAQADLIYEDIESKRRATRYLHSGALLPEPVAEIAEGGESEIAERFYARCAELQSLQTLPDKPQETVPATMQALWHLAAGRPLSAEEATEHPLPALDANAEQRLTTLVARRLSGVPLAHLTGRQRFMGLEMLAGKEALIPRPETELLGRTAANLLQTMARDGRRPNVLDVCTGSGNLGLALAHRVPSAQVFASDLSKEAVGLARRNAVHLNLADRVEFRDGDLLEPFNNPSFHGKVDLLVCNPPYMSTNKVPRLAGEIADFEPHEAFDGGPLGVGILLRLIREAPLYLTPTGWLAFEVGVGQGPAMLKRVLAQGEFRQHRLVTDSLGEVRVVLASR